jgi:hypothetical protein
VPHIMGEFPRSDGSTETTCVGCEAKLLVFPGDQVHVLILPNDLLAPMCSGCASAIIDQVHLARMDEVS